MLGAAQYTKQLAKTPRIDSAERYFHLAGVQPRVFAIMAGRLCYFLDPLMNLNHTLVDAQQTHWTRVLRNFWAEKL